MPHYFGNCSLLMMRKSKKLKDEAMSEIKEAVIDSITAVVEFFLNQNFVGTVKPYCKSGNCFALRI